MKTLKQIHRNWLDKYVTKIRCGDSIENQLRKEAKKIIKSYIKQIDHNSSWKQDIELHHYILWIRKFFNINLKEMKEIIKEVENETD